MTARCPYPTAMTSAWTAAYDSLPMKSCIAVTRFVSMQQFAIGSSYTRVTRLGQMICRKLQLANRALV